jgi:hypothetical protein
MAWQRRQIESLVPSCLRTCWKSNSSLFPEAGGIGVAKKRSHFLRCIASGALLTLHAVCAEVARGRRRSEPELGAIRHPHVQVEKSAGVEAFLVGEPVLIPGGGYGPVAAEAYRVTGSVGVMPVLETGAELEVKAGRDEVQSCCGHVLACFQTPERVTVGISILRFRLIRLS